MKEPLTMHTQEAALCTPSEDEVYASALVELSLADMDPHPNQMLQQPDGNKE